MAWWDQFFKPPLPLYTQPPVPWSYNEQPMYTLPPVPDHFNPPSNDAPGMYGFDWGEGLPADAVRRNMPNSSVSHGQNLAEQIRQQIKMSTPPASAPAVPPVPTMRGPMAPVPPATPQPMPTEQFATAPRPAGVPQEQPNIDVLLNTLAQKESGGKYDALGPTVTYKSGKQDRAYGKYQVMGANIPSWTKEHLGVSMTPEQFVASPEAQERVARAQFSKYLQQTGNHRDAVAMWASGRPLAQSRNDRDLAFGFKVGDYVTDFDKRLGSRNVMPASSPPPSEIRGPATAPATAEQAPQRPGFDWGPDANIWQIALGASKGLMQPTLYGTTGALTQGLAGATDAAQTGQDRSLKRALLKAQVGEAQGKADQRKLATRLATNPNIPAAVRGFFSLGLHEKGMEEWAKRDPEGWQAEAQRLGLIEGAKKSAEMAATREATEAGMGKALAQSAHTVLGKIAEARSKAKDSWWATGAPAFATDFLPFTSAGELKQTVSTIRANIGFDKLAQMRLDSPTGGALGQVAVQELRALQDSIASLETATKKDVFLSRLSDVERHYKAIMDKYGHRIYTGGQSATAPTSTDMGNGWSVRVK